MSATATGGAGGNGGAVTFTRSGTVVEPTPGQGPQLLVGHHR